MKIAHRNNTHGVHYVKLKSWWVATIVMALGEIGNTMA
jgi:hypothetical protein